jgi:mannopine transport system permease protein
MIAPILIVLLAAFYLPVFQLLATSFGWPRFSLQNYQRLYNDSLYALVLLRTVRISALVTLFCLLIGYPVAWLLARVNGWKASVLAGLILLPLWTSVLVRTYAWTVLLQRTGLLNSLLLWSGLTAQPLQLLYTEGAVIAAMVHVLLPFMILPLWSALRQISRAYERAARVLGCSGARILVSVTIPLSTGGIWTGCLFVFLLSLGFFVTPALIGGPRQMMIATLISQQALDLLDWPFVSAIGVVMIALVLIGLSLTRRVFRFDLQERVQ